MLRSETSTQTKRKRSFVGTFPIAARKSQSTRLLIMGSDPVPDIFVEGEWLRNPDFNFPRWYRLEVAGRLGHARCTRRIKGERMDDALALGLERYLERRVPYPQAWRDYLGPQIVGPRYCCYTSLDDESVVQVYDAYLFTSTEVSVEALTNSRFDIANAYAVGLRSAFQAEPFELDDLDGELEALFDMREADRLAEDETLAHGLLPILSPVSSVTRRSLATFVGECLTP